MGFEMRIWIWSNAQTRLERCSDLSEGNARESGHHPDHRDARGAIGTPLLPAAV
jgi:hypothetical protein